MADFPIKATAFHVVYYNGVLESCLNVWKASGVLCSNELNWVENREGQVEAPGFYVKSKGSASALNIKILKNHRVLPDTV